jgi:hypothetical protein
MKIGSAEISIRRIVSALLVANLIYHIWQIWAFGDYYLQWELDNMVNYAPGYGLFRGERIYSYLMMTFATILLILFINGKRIRAWWCYAFLTVWTFAIYLHWSGGAINTMFLVLYFHTQLGMGFFFALGYVIKDAKK